MNSIFRTYKGCCVYPGIAMILVAAAIASAETKFETLNGFEPHFVLPPEQTTVRNIKTDYGAVGDGQTDDTQAFKDWLAAKERRLYIPEGTYLISEPLRWTDGMKKVAIFGEQRSTTIIKLADSSSGFADTTIPQAFIHTKAPNESPEQNFYTSIRHVTIEIGTGNPGAVALVFHTNNTGMIKDVTIRAPDPDNSKGFIGAAFGDHSFGPGSARYLEVEGFRTGVYVGSAQNHVTLEHLTVKNCALGIHGSGLPWHLLYNGAESLTWDGLYDLRVSANPDTLAGNGYGLSMRGITTESCLQGIQLDIGDTSDHGHAGHAVMTDVQLNGGSGGDAMSINAVAQISKLETDGYDRAINSVTPAGNNDGPDVSFYASHDVISNWTPGAGMDGSLLIPVSESPELQYPQSSSDWAVIGAGIGDITLALQTAIDNGVKTIYIQGGIISDTIHLRNNLERIMCLGWNPLGFNTDSTTPVFRLEDGTAPFVIVEFIYKSSGTSSLIYEQASTRQFVIRQGSGNYANTPESYGGQLFIESHVSDQVSFVKLLVRARDLNTELGGDNVPNVLNDSSVVWILGHKTEDFATKIKTVNNGITELLGGTYRQNWGTNKATDTLVENNPLFIVDNAHAALSFCTWQAWWKVSTNYKYMVQETRGTETRNIMHQQYDAVNGYNGRQALFVGYNRTVDLVRRPILSNRSRLRFDGFRTVSFFTAQGRLVSKFTADKTADLQGEIFRRQALMPAGFYLIRISDKNKTVMINTRGVLLD
ncbi:MAG: hypothetical protein GF401_00395 [Chitinivibrionales bacterium]|nr:hypothetical protein [Chitinivibrionales bacterium]